MYALLVLALGSAFELCFGTDIERLDNASIHCGNNIHRSIQVGIGNPGFPCVRKAPFHSWLAIADHGDSQSHEDLLTLTQIGDGMGVAIKLPEVGFFRHWLLLIVLASMPLFPGLGTWRTYAQQYIDSPLQMPLGQELVMGEKGER